MNRLIGNVVLAIGGSLVATILVKVTITTGLALFATAMARRSRASVRHVVLTACFALLLVLPIASILAPPFRIPVPVSMTGKAVSVPLAAASRETSFTATDNSTTTAGNATSQATSLSSSVLWFSGWMIGTLVFLLPVAVGLWQTRSLRRSGLPWLHGQRIASELAIQIGIGRHVDVLLHEHVPGPMTCGIVHPAVLLPADAQTWLGEDLRRAVVHELEHIRRGDWISRCIARSLSAFYWFHPLVWITWHQLVLEAERACDDVVLRHSEATDYADQLVGLAQRLSLASEPAAPVFLGMANRDDLARRVSALLDRRQRRGRAGTLWIVLACAVSVMLVTAISPLHVVARSQTSAGQSPSADSQRFEVASIKPCKDEPVLPNGQRRQEFMTSPGRVKVDCRPLDRIVYFAYGGVGNQNDPLINDNPGDPTHVRGGPGWVHSENFTIEATAEGIPDRTVMMGPMLRALLAERFQLKVHRELEEVPMYALTVAKGGLKIQPIAEGDCIKPDTVINLSQEDRRAILQGPKPVCGSFGSLGDGVNRHWVLGGESMDRFANSILSGVLDRHVMDKTGVSGRFNIRLDFGLDENIRAGVFGGAPSTAYSAENPPPLGIDKGPAIFAALEEQLGLKLEKTKGSRGFIVIDSAERPSGM